MPVPTPKKSEKKQEFLSRCIADLTSNEKETFPSGSQRAAVCYFQWGETSAKKGKAPKKASKKAVKKPKGQTSSPAGT